MPATDRKDSLPTGSQLHSYIVEKVLGSGAFGITYLVKHAFLESWYVIKEYLPECAMREHGRTTVIPKGTKDRELFDWGFKCFFKEAKLLHQLSHPNIVKVTDIFTSNNTAYYVMPYIKGITLYDWIKRNKNPNQSELESIFVSLLEGLKYIHERKLLHRDIKPENIYLSEKGNPVLIDFGSARMAIGQKSKALTQVLTPGFAPIEQYSTKGSFTPALDLYSLGACIYMAITGKLPDEAPDRLENDKLPKLAGSSYENRFATHFLDAIDKSLSLYSKNRYQNGFDMQKDLVGGFSFAVPDADGLQTSNIQKNSSQEASLDQDSEIIVQESIDDHSPKDLNAENNLTQTTTFPATRWPRFFARIFDLWVGVIVISFLFEIILGRYSATYVSMVYSYGSTYIMGIVYLPFALLLDALVYRLCGNTPGKWLLGIKVYHSENRKLTFGEYLQRNLYLWASGLALGIPLLNLIAMIIQYSRIGRGLQTTYDQGAEFRVVSRKTGLHRKVSFGIVFILLFFVNTIFYSIEQEMQHENLLRSMQQHFSWENPQTMSRAQIDPVWKYNLEYNEDGQEIYVFYEISDRAFVVMGFEDSHETILSDYVWWFRLSTDEHMSFSDGGNYFQIRGYSGWEASGLLKGAGANRLNIRIVQTGSRFWRIVTVQSMPYSYSDEMVSSLENDLWNTVIR